MLAPLTLTALGLLHPPGDDPRITIARRLMEGAGVEQSVSSRYTTLSRAAALFRLAGDEDSARAAGQAAIDAGRGDDRKETRASVSLASAGFALAIVGERDAGREAVRVACEAARAEPEGRARIDSLLRVARIAHRLEFRDLARDLGAEALDAIEASRDKAVVEHRADLKADALVASGDFHEALAAILEIPDGDPHFPGLQREVTLLRLASESYPADRDRAEVILSEALPLAYGIAGTPQPGVVRSPSPLLSVFAFALAKLGRLDEAEAVAIALPEDSPNGSFRGTLLNIKAETYRALAKRAALEGQRPRAAAWAAEAARLAARIEPPEVARGGVLEIAMRQAEVGDLEGARQTLETLPPATRLQGLTRLTQLPVEVMDRDSRRAVAVEARALAERLLAEPPPLGPTTREEINLAKSLKVEPTEDWRRLQQRDAILSELVAARAFLGDLTGARDAAGQVSDPKGSRSAVVRMAVERARADDLDGAIAIVEAIDDPQRRLQGYSQIAALLVGWQPDDSP